MNAKRLLIGTVVGAVALYGLGQLIWQVIFADFFAANVGSATGVARSPRLEWAVILASVAQGVLLTLAIGTKGSSTSIATGFKVGAIVGFLIWFSIDFLFYGTNNLHTLTATIVDPFLELVHWGISGAIVAVVMQRLNQFERPRETASIAAIRT